MQRSFMKNVKEHKECNILFIKNAKERKNARSFEKNSKQLIYILVLYTIRNSYNVQCKVDNHGWQYNWCDCFEAVTTRRAETRGLELKSLE